MPCLKTVYDERLIFTKIYCSKFHWFDLNTVEEV